MTRRCEHDPVGWEAVRAARAATGRAATCLPRWG
jgi:hypothetical protein